MLDTFSYINIPEWSGDLFHDSKELLCSNNKQKTFEHCAAVAKTNREIAEKYGLDKSICEISGFLHDISTIIKPEDMLAYAQLADWYIDEAEKKYPFLLHQRLSKQIAEQDFHIIDQRILSAMECHTTLKDNPSPYDMALFVADKLSWDQDGLPPFYEVVSGALDISLESASLAYMTYTLENNMVLYPHKWFSEGFAFLNNR